MDWSDETLERDVATSAILCNSAPVGSLTGATLIGRFITA